MTTSALKDLQESIDDIVAMRRSHINWAKYFEANPDIEKEYIATGKWDSAKKHRDYVKKYDKVLIYLNSLK